MKYLNRYRVESHRRPDWDYSADGFYFITLVTQGRICNLGKIDKSNQMILSDFGKIVETEWLRSFEIRQELICDEYIIMPNHLHAIIIIDQSQSMNDSGSGSGSVQTHGRASLRPSPSQSLRQSPSQSTPSRSPFDSPPDSISHSPSDLPSQPPSDSTHQSPLPVRLPKSTSSFLAGFKSAVNSKIDDFIDLHHLKIPKYNRHNHFFQPNYHDHIVRNAEEYRRIKNYIIQNPKKWNDDRFRN